MDSLPFVDEHVRRVHAPKDRVWSALLTTVQKQFSADLPVWLSSLWGLQQTVRAGDWTEGPAVGDTILGFSVGASEPGALLSLCGSHRFSRYELRFELDAAPSGDVALRAKTFAVFPGWHGRAYRALVIGTGGHRIAVRRMLSAVARKVS